MKFFIKVIFILGLFILSGLSQAVIRTHIISTENGSGRTFKLTGSIDAWDEDDKAPNPCYKDSYCLIVIAMHDIVKNEGSPELNYVSYDISNIATIGEVGKVFKKEFSIPYVKSFTAGAKWLPIENMCLSISYCSTEGGGCSTPSYKLPSTLCGTAPPVDLTCNILSAVILEHGTLTTDQVNGHQAATKIRVTCNQDATILAQSLGENSNKNIQLKPDGSLESEILINGTPGSDGGKIEVRENIASEINITSTLIQHGELDEGSFHGSGTLIIKMP